MDREETAPQCSSLPSTQHAQHQPQPQLLKGYEYTVFNPKPLHHSLPGESCMSPTQPSCLNALVDLKKILHPRDTGCGYKDPQLDLWRHAQLGGMISMLNMFMRWESWTYNHWGASACQAAVGMGQGKHCTRHLCELNQTFLADQTILPVNPYGDWNESLLTDETIINEINIYLLFLGNKIMAKKLMDFLHRADIKEKYGIEWDINHKTACRYLRALGYQFQYTPKGQYLTLPSIFHMEWCIKYDQIETLTMEYTWNGMEWSWNPHGVFHMDSMDSIPYSMASMDSMDSMDSRWNGVLIPHFCFN